MTIYRGLPGNEARRAPLTVTGATNATPIVVTTSAAHGLDSGEFIDLYGAIGNTAANGRFFVNVLSSTTFALYFGWTAGAPSTAVAGAGAWTSGGTVQARGFAAAVTLPDNGNSVTAESVKVPFEGDQDREAYLLQRVGAASLAQLDELTNRPAATPSASWRNAATANGSWTTRTALGITTIPVGPGDVVKLAFQGTALTQATFHIGLRLYTKVVKWDGSGGTLIAGPSIYLPLSLYCPVNLQQTYVNPSAEFLKLVVYLADFGDAGTPSYDMVGDYSLITEIWSPN